MRTCAHILARPSPPSESTTADAGAHDCKRAGARARAHTHVLRLAEHALELVVLRARLRRPVACADPFGCLLGCLAALLLSDRSRLDFVTPSPAGALAGGSEATKLCNHAPIACSTFAGAPFASR